PSSAEEGRALAQPAPGWCDRSLRKPPIECFVSQTCIFDTKHSNDEFRVTLQTTPVPLRDRRRCAALPLLISGGEPEKRPISGHSLCDVSVKSGVNLPAGYYGLGVLASDFDNDGWPDIYVATDTTPSILFRNNRDGTFTDIAVLAGCAYDENGKSQGGMGLAAADYNRNGWLDVFKTNFSEETPNLYHNRRKAFFHDVVYSAGIAKNTRLVGWGCGFFDPDNDGWPDLFYCNGHVYPELARSDLEVQYLQPRMLFRNLRNGRFEDVSAQAGPPIQLPSNGRGCAFGDFDNDGDLDIVINNMNDVPSLLRCDRKNRNHWIKVRLVGTRSNRSGIGARMKCVTGSLVQIDEVRSGGSYLSHNDLRIHFGLGMAEKVDLLEIRWPSGQIDSFRNLAVDRIVVAKEGARVVEGK
ncbi:MAG: CRTAC1 family protein, partial [Acidobacteria bacterium]|nr:CRTAC1 family protein [Acidobacteriota bacterium]